MGQFILIGFSADALAASNLHKVGRRSKRYDAPVLYGKVPRKGSAKAPFLVSDVPASMKLANGAQDLLSVGDLVTSELLLFNAIKAKIPIRHLSAH